MQVSLDFLLYGFIAKKEKLEIQIYYIYLLMSRIKYKVYTINIYFDILNWVLSTQDKLKTSQLGLNVVFANTEINTKKLKIFNSCDIFEQRRFLRTAKFEQFQSALDNFETYVKFYHIINCFYPFVFYFFLRCF